MSWMNVANMECIVNEIDRMLVDIDCESDEVIFEINHESVVISVEEAKKFAMNLLDVCWGEPTTTVPTNKLFELLKKGEDEDEDQ